MADSQLKLIALDEQDLEIVSSHLQDAVVRVGDLAYVPSQKRFAAILNRFNWEKAAKTAANDTNERRRTALRFDRVLGAQIKSLKPSASDRVLSLLAVRFEAERAPERLCDADLFRRRLDPPPRRMHRGRAHRSWACLARPLKTAAPWRRARG